MLRAVHFLYRCRPRASPRRGLAARFSSAPSRCSRARWRNTRPPRLRSPPCPPLRAQQTRSIALVSSSTMSTAMQQRIEEMRELVKAARRRFPWYDALIAASAYDRDDDPRSLPYLDEELLGAHYYENDDPGEAPALTYRTSGTRHRQAEAGRLLGQGPRTVHRPADGDPREESGGRRARRLRGSGDRPCCRLGSRHLPCAAPGSTRR